MILNPIAKALKSHAAILLINAIFLKYALGKPLDQLMDARRLDFDIGLAYFHIEGCPSFVILFVQLVYDLCSVFALHLFGVALALIEPKCATG